MCVPQFKLNPHVANCQTNWKFISVSIPKQRYLPKFTSVDFQVVLHWESSGLWQEDPVLRQPRPHHLLQVGSYHIIYIILLPILISPFPSDPKLPFLSSSSFWGSIQARTWRDWQRLWALKQNRNTCSTLRNKVLNFSLRNTCRSLIQFFYL